MLNRIVLLGTRSGWCLARKIWERIGVSVFEDQLFEHRSLDGASVLWWFRLCFDFKVVCRVLRWRLKGCRSDQSGVMN